MEFVKLDNCRKRSLVINREYFGKLEKHTINYYPKEACALLYGAVLNRKIIIKDISTTINTSRTKNHFRINKNQIERGCAKSNQKLLGVYHSHILNHGPSPGDLNGMQKHKGIWLIGYLKQNYFKIAAYYLDDDQVYNLKIKEEL